MKLGVDASELVPLLQAQGVTADDLDASPANDKGALSSLRAAFKKGRH